MSQFFDSFILLFGGVILIGGLQKLGSWLGAVRSLRFRPSFARLDAMTGARWLGIASGSGIVLLAFGVVAVFAGIFLYGGTGATGSVRKTLALVLLGAGGFSCWHDGRPYRGEPAPEQPAGSAHAKVTRTTSAPGPERSGSRRPLGPGPPSTPVTPGSYSG